MREYLCIWKKTGALQIWCDWGCIGFPYQNEWRIEHVKVKSYDPKYFDNYYKYLKSCFSETNTPPEYLVEVIEEWQE